MPEECVGKTFEALLLFLLDRKLVTLGLYRKEGATDNTYPYVFTNPKYDTLITHRDRAFVLGVKVPTDLRENKEQEAKFIFENHNKNPDERREDKEE